MKKIINKYRQNLNWSIIDIQGSNFYQIVSDDLRKEHHLYHPPVARKIEYLHELCHAKLAEDNCVLFSTSYFSPDSVNVGGCAVFFNIATDWFVDYELHKICPEESKKSIREMMAHISHVNDPVISGFTSAQVKKYLGEHFSSYGVGNKVREILLDINPEAETSNLETLIRRLISLVGYTAKIEFRERPVWVVRKTI